MGGGYFSDDRLCLKRSLYTRGPRDSAGRVRWGGGGESK